MMNNTINNYLLAGDTFMPETRLRQPGFMYNACWEFTHTKKQEHKNSKTHETLDISMAIK